MDDFIHLNTDFLKCYTVSANVKHYKSEKLGEPCVSSVQICSTSPHLQHCKTCIKLADLIRISSAKFLARITNWFYE